MTPEIEAGIILGLMIALAIFFAYRSYVSIAAYIRFKKAYKKYPAAIKADDICKDPHEYETIALALRGVAPGAHKVCKKCGFIAGTNYKLNAPGLEAMQEGMKLQADKAQKERQVAHRIQFDLECLRDNWAHSQVKKAFEDPDNAEQVLKDTFDYAIRANLQVREKIAAELEAEAERERQYKNWGRFH